MHLKPHIISKMAKYLLSLFSTINMKNKATKQLLEVQSTSSKYNYVFMQDLIKNTNTYFVSKFYIEIILNEKCYYYKFIF